MLHPSILGGAWAAEEAALCLDVAQLAGTAACRFLFSSAQQNLATGKAPVDKLDEHKAQICWKQAECFFQASPVYYLNHHFGPAVLFDRSLLQSSW